jgi:hypothetical protein
MHVICPSVACSAAMNARLNHLCCPARTRLHHHIALTIFSCTQQMYSEEVDADIAAASLLLEEQDDFPHALATDSFHFRTSTAPAHRPARVSAAGTPMSWSSQSPRARAHAQTAGYGADKEAPSYADRRARTLALKNNGDSITVPRTVRGIGEVIEAKGNLLEAHCRYLPASHMIQHCCVTYISNLFMLCMRRHCVFLRVVYHVCLRTKVFIEQARSSTASKCDSLLT